MSLTCEMLSQPWHNSVCWSVSLLTRCWLHRGWQRWDAVCFYVVQETESFKSFNGLSVWSDLIHVLHIVCSSRCHSELNAPRHFDVLHQLERIPWVGYSSCNNSKPRIPSVSRLGLQKAALDRDVRANSWVCWVETRRRSSGFVLKRGGGSGGGGRRGKFVSVPQSHYCKERKGGFA